MAFIINQPKNVILLPLFILLAIIVIPFAIFFSLIRLPFAKRRVRGLSNILANDWQPRKKYVYIGLTGGFKLTDYIKENILSNQNIVWDEWDGGQNKWLSSEEDKFGRITIFWQDIGGEFDGDPKVFIATYRPGDFEVARNKGNFHEFSLDESDDYVVYGEEKLSVSEAQTKVQEIVDGALADWSKI